MNTRPDLYIIIINGPNLNKLGSRNPMLYGDEPFENTLEKLRKIAGKAFRLEYYQTNSEGEIIDILQRHGDGMKPCAGFILNPGAYAHYSYAIADAIRDVWYEAPVVEVHISNIFNREDYRRQTVTGGACEGVISGFGRRSYALALQYLIEYNHELMKSLKAMNNHDDDLPF